MGIFHHSIMEYTIFKCLCEVDHQPIVRIPTPLVLVPRVQLQDISVENLCLAGQDIFSVPGPIEAIYQYTRATEYCSS
jgi:hypothetical protein